MTTLTKTATITVIVIAAVYAMTLINQDEPQIKALDTQTTNDVIKAPVSIQPDVQPAQQEAPQPAKHSMANQILNKPEKTKTQQNEAEPRAELSQHSRLAPPPPLAPGESLSSRHKNAAKKSDLGHAHDHANIAEEEDNNQPAPPAGVQR
ncbi:hypothetical protein NBRC116592_09660 [Colwellia sp. KU-HH00111]|uniref:hypothetical protein n=1 Tax=Colwellia sp. KU-HH00111 TaxID=3127652 RepID=UPI0031064E49